VTVHDLFTLEHPEWFSGAFAKGYRMITPALLRNARHVIAVSEFTKRQVVTLTGVDSDKVTVIYNGIGPQFAPQTETDIRAARAAIGLPSGAYFLSVASLEPRKNVARILKAWAKALPHIPEHYSLVLAGSAESIFASLDLNEIPPRVVFPGYVADQHLPALYAGARAFVFPSLAEGFGLPPLEAMACGTAVLTSDSSALSEVTGTAGYTVDPTNIHAIAAGMVDLATNDILCDTLQQKGRAQAARFCWTRAASQTLAVLEKEVAAQ
jgi:glycosyltransferase involved in cell wall biosynthesis